MFSFEVVFFSSNNNAVRFSEIRILRKQSSSSTVSLLTVILVKTGFGQVFQELIIFMHVINLTDKLRTF